MAGLAGLGAFAGGFAGGMERGQDMGARREIMDRQRKRWNTEDALQEDMNAANQAAAAVVRRYQQQYEAQKPQAILDGQPIQQSTPFQPNIEHLLEANRARSDALFARKRTDEGFKVWLQNEELNRGVRKEAVSKGLLSFQASGDPTELLRGIDKTVDNGWDITGVQAQQGPNGPAWVVSRQNKVTGKTDSHPITADQIEGLTQFALDPKESAKYSLMTKLEAFKADQDMRVLRERGAQSEKLEGTRSKFDLFEAGERHKYRLGEIAAEGKERRGQIAAEGKERRDTATRTVDTELIRALREERVAADKEIDSLVTRLKDARSSERPALQAEIAEARKRSNEVRDRLAKLSDAGMEKRGLGETKPSTMPAGLPKGSKQIGTQNGKPVYRTPDGKQFIDD